LNPLEEYGYRNENFRKLFHFREESVMYLTDILKEGYSIKLDEDSLFCLCRIVVKVVSKMLDRCSNDIGHFAILLIFVGHARFFLLPVFFDSLVWWSNSFLV